MEKEKFMAKALKLAREAEQRGEVPVGAVLVKEGEIIAEGFNRVIGTNDPTAHAEIITLRKGGEKLNNYRLLNTELYTTLEPCLMCFSALVQARIKKLSFGAFDHKAGIFSTGIFEKVKMVYNHSLQIESGIMQKACSKILQEFFIKRRDAGAAERDGLENR